MLKCFRLHKDRALLNRKLLHRWSKQHDSSEEKLLGAVIMLFMLNEQISLPRGEQPNAEKESSLVEDTESPWRKSSNSSPRAKRRSGQRALAFRKSITYDSRLTERESSGFNTPSAYQMDPKINIAVIPRNHVIQDDSPDKKSQ